MDRDHRWVLVVGIGIGLVAASLALLAFDRGPTPAQIQRRAAQMGMIRRDEVLPRYALVVPQGITATELADTLGATGIGIDGSALKKAFREAGLDGRVTPGVYWLEAAWGPEEIARALQR